MDKLRSYISSLVDISQTDLDSVCSNFKKVKLKKSDFFLKQGDVSEYIIFVNSGLLRKFAINDKGQEVTYFFPEVGTLVSSLSIFQPISISEVSIQAVIDSELMIIHRNDLNNIYQKLPKFNIFGRKALETIVVLLEKRIFLLMNYTAEDRYNIFREENPLVMQHVHLKCLSTYLSITPQHLSRIRKYK